MGTTQAQKAEEDLHEALPGNPFVPPKGGVCLINNLPPELLSCIFEVGSEDDILEDEDDVADLWDNFRHYLEAKVADEPDTCDSEVGTEEDSADDEDETDNRVGSDSGTASSDLSSPWPPFPIVVSCVCRHWRDVALSTPSLWTTIPVAPQARPPYMPVSTLLERSKDHLIDIYINCTPEYDDYDIDPPSIADLEFLYAMLIPHVHRWRTIEVSVSDYHHMHVFLSAVSQPSIPSALQLTTLELYHHEETDQFDHFAFPGISKHLSLFGGSAPMLTSLILWGVHVDWDQPWIASASNLKELELAFHAEDVRPSWTQFTSLLRGAPSLEKLSLRQSGPSGDPPEWFIQPTVSCPSDLNAPIQLLRATDFIIAFHSEVRAIGFIRKFYLPALKNLVLDFDNGDYTQLVCELVRPATSLSLSQEQPSSLLSKLESLKIAGLPCRHECTSQLYGELQNLKSLNISLVYLPLCFLDILCTPCVLPGRGGIWLPRLETLYVSGVSGGALREVVRERKNAGVPLRSLYVEESSDVDSQDVRWLKENVGTFEFFEGSEDEDDDDEGTPLIEQLDYPSD